MSVQARMKVSHIIDYGTSKQVHFTAVTTGDETSPNYSYSKYTPCAKLEMSITNPAAYDQFEVNHEYDLTFTPTEN